jgi:hypothetical protein
MAAMVVIGFGAAGCVAPGGTAGPSSTGASVPGSFGPGSILGGSVPATPGTLAIGDPGAPMPAAGACTLRPVGDQVLPDPACTPGTTNPSVTQDNIDETVCQSGWTKTVRPSTSVTNRMKKLSLASYGLDPATAGEYDHLVSLELGGAPADPRNLWVEPGKIPNAKDTTENRLSEAVCARLIPLALAQTVIAHDWTTALDDAGLAMINGHLCLKADPTRCGSGRRGDDD